MDCQSYIQKFPNQKQQIDLEKLKLWFSFYKFIATLAFGTALGIVLSWNIEHREIQIKEQEQLERYFQYTMTGDVYDRLKLSLYFQKVLKDEKHAKHWGNYFLEQNNLLGEYSDIVWKLGTIEEQLQSTNLSPEEKNKLEKERYDLEHRKTTLKKLIDPVESLKKAITHTFISENNAQWGTIHIPLILKSCQEFQIQDLAQVAYILATAQYETNYGIYMEELSGTIYEGRRDLGNTQFGDGERYKGRGYVLLTGRANYSKWSESLKIDLINNPDQAAQPEIAAKILVIGMRDGLFTGRK